MNTDVTRPLVRLSLGMAALVPLLVIGLVIDPRVVTGAPVWQKPLKFVLSIAIYAGSLALILRHVDVWPGRLRVASRVVAWGLWLEIAIISLQAARGTRSHFNDATPFDEALFQVMGAGIVAVTLASAVIAAALFRQRFADRALGWAVRLGLVLSIAGALLGGAMIGLGAHTVGAPDGGAGLPFANWSTGHGDLRAAHFAGLHALQVLPLLALVTRRLRRPRDERQRVALVLVGAASYAGLVAILFWQALRGESIVASGSQSLPVFLAWFGLSAAAAMLVGPRRSPSGGGPLSRAVRP
ncbi:MAG TPA: hypothetical protein VF406_02285 [Thermodesulfobacteriota bacterium]